MKKYLISIVEINAQIYSMRPYFSIPIDCMISAVSGFLSATSTAITEKQAQKLERYIMGYMYPCPDSRRRAAGIVERSIVGEIQYR